MAVLHQVVLAGKNLSGRGVKFKSLSPTEHDQITMDAAKQLTQSSTVVELRKIEWSMGARRMLTHVTKESGIDDPLATGATWQPLSAATIDEKYDELFNVKDHEMLVSLYRSYHEVSEAEVNALQGKVVAVSAD